ncbi:MAG: M6 family metalloprotease domain-containing protein [Bacteroidaceae bacterium]|nr:M6 family metalloprotease domain-containing protein [Bacteroidaceae bacterium]
MRQKLLSLLCLTLIVSALTGAPARLSFFTHSQPDGSTVSISLSGNEHNRFHITSDGIMVTLCDDGACRYVTSISDGLPIPGDMLAHDPSQRTAAEKTALSHVSQQELHEAFKAGNLIDSDLYDQVARPGEYSISTAKTTGQVNIPVLLVNFPDKPFTLSDSLIRKRIDDQMNLRGYTSRLTYNGNTGIGAIGSVRDYFESQSFGQFSPTFKIIGPITADSSYIYYGKNQGNDDVHAEQLMTEICQKAYRRGLLKTSDFCTDDDKVIDAVYLLYAGRGENYSHSDPNTIWPHYRPLSLNLGQTKVASGICSCELFYNTDTIIDGIGLFCHEYCHALGLPDFYDTRSEKVFALKSWSLMDYGLYDNNDFAPTGMTAFERFSLGWMDLEIIQSPGRYSLSALDDGKAAYRLNTEDPHKFIILENHGKTGWFRFQPSLGLMATAVSYTTRAWSGNTVNVSASNKGYSIIPADYIYSTQTQADDLYPYGNKDSITYNSLPAASINGAIQTDFTIHNITYSDGTVRFEAIGTATPVKAVSQDTGLSVTAGRGYLTVTAPSEITVTVWSISSRLQSTIQGSSTVSLQPGIYLIRAGGTAHKAIVF